MDETTSTTGLAGIDDPRALLEGLFAHAPVAFQIYRADGRSLLVNPAFRELFGSEPPPDYDIFRDEIATKQGMTEQIRRAFQGETVRLPAFWYDPRDLEHVEVTEGRRVAIEITMFPLLDAQRGLGHVAFCFKDVTSEMERRQERDHLRALQECSVEITTIHRADTTAPVVSPSVRRILGWSEEEFGQRGRALMHPDDRARVDPGELLRNPGVALHTEYRMQHRDGSWRRMSVTAINLLDHPTIAGIVAHHHDVTDLHEAIEAARRSEQELAATLHSIGDAVIATDSSGSVVRMNPVAEQLTGWDVSIATGKKLHEVFHVVDETTRQPVDNPMTRVLREGAVVGLANHTVLIARDGSERSIANSGAPIRDVDGNVHGVVLVFRDQSEEYRALRALQRSEEALRKSEGRFRRLSDAGFIGIITADFQGNLREANDAFLEMVGYSSGEVLSGAIGWAAMTPPEWRSLDERAIEQLKTVGVAAAWEKEYQRKDGSRVPVLVGAALLEESDGESVAFVLDLTERHRAETAVRESEARKTAVMEAALDAIVLMDHEGRITEFNPAAERTFGYSREEVLGKLLADVLIAPSLRAMHSEGLKRYLKTGESRVIGTRIELPAVRKGGAEFPAEVAVVRIRSEGPPLFTGYIRDITERRQASEAESLRRAKEAAEEASSELEAFSYSVAHDLRAPLRAINGFSSAVLEDWGDRLDEEARAHLARVISGADRMALLIDDLLSLARLTGIDPQREPVDLTSLAAKVMEDLRASDPTRSVAFAAAEGLMVRGDPGLLGALLENLLGNAWKFTSTRSAARIELGREVIDGTSVFYVRDDGVGFDMSHVGKLFAPFRRLHSSEAFEGTGIGLATVQRIVRRHGGRIWAEGAENQGATFRFTLPGPRQGGRS